MKNERKEEEEVKQLTDVKCPKCGKEFLSPAPGRVICTCGQRIRIPRASAKDKMIAKLQQALVDAENQVMYMTSVFATFIRTAGWEQDGTVKVYVSTGEMIDTAKKGGTLKWSKVGESHICEYEENGGAGETATKEAAAAQTETQQLQE